MILSPAWAMVDMARNCAACPEDTARAATPPSRAARRFSKTSFVGCPAHSSSAPFNQATIPQNQELRVGGPGTYVHDPGINIPKFLETEQPRSMSRVIEDKRLYNVPN